MYRPSSPRARPSHAGLSPAELLIATFLLLIVLFALSLVYEWSMTTAAWGNKKLEVQESAQVAVEVMERAVRMTGYDPSNTGQAAIQSVPLSPTDLVIVGDLDGDGVTEKAQYTFHQADGTLTRNTWRWNGGGWTPITQGPEILARGISSLTFTYCDATATCDPPPPAQAVRMIAIALTASGAAGSATETLTIDSKVRLRNL